MSTIPLAKGYKPEKLNFPVLVSTKYDGVPCKLTINVTPDGLTWEHTSRSGKPLPSVGEMMDLFVRRTAPLLNFGVHKFVGELVLRSDWFAPFKDVGGTVRRSYDQSQDLHWQIFDYHHDLGPDGYQERMHNLRLIVSGLYFAEAVYTVSVPDEPALKYYFEKFSKDAPWAEGLVARSHDDTFEEGKRSWGYQKMLIEPTIDLQIVNFEEATTKDGEPMGMVGRLVASYKDDRIGVGPGKLTHRERKSLWAEFGAFTSTTPRIAKIKYKKDDSYDALRQPTFQCWADKTEPDA